MNASNGVLPSNVCDPVRPSRHVAHYSTHNYPVAVSVPFGPAQPERSRKVAGPSRHRRLARLAPRQRVGHRGLRAVTAGRTDRLRDGGGLCAQALPDWRFGPRG